VSSSSSQTSSAALLASESDKDEPDGPLAGPPQGDIADERPTLPFTA